MKGLQRDERTGIKMRQIRKFLIVLIPLLVLTIDLNVLEASGANKNSYHNPTLQFSKDVCDPKMGKLKCKNYKFGGDWSRINFAKADLRGAIFEEGARFYGANFSGANLDGADFRSSRQKNAPIGDDFDPNYVVCGSTSCPKVVDLRNANFSNASLSNVYFGSALLSGANFNSAWLSNASFSSQNNNTFLDMSRTSFIDAYMEDASFYRVNLASANFSKARLSRAQFLSTDLTKTNFLSAMLAGANFSSALISSTNFQNANLGKTRFANGCKPNKSVSTTCR